MAVVAVQHTAPTNGHCKFKLIGQWHQFTYQLMAAVVVMIMITIMKMVYDSFGGSAGVKAAISILFGSRWLQHQNLYDYLYVCLGCPNLVLLFWT